MQNGEIIQIDGEKFRVELHEVKVPTYEEALEVVKPSFCARTVSADILDYSRVSDRTRIYKGNVPTERDALSLIAYQKLKVLEAYYNEGKQGEWGLFLTAKIFLVVMEKDIFNLKDQETAHRFIEEQKRLLKQFYQI